MKQFAKPGDFCLNEARPDLLKIVFGNKAEVIQLLGESTAYIEHGHLPSRLFNGHQVRKTLAFSKDVDCYRSATAWEDAYYNLVKPYKSLRLRIHDIPEREWQPRTPSDERKPHQSYLGCYGTIDNHPVSVLTALNRETTQFCDHV